MRGRTRYVVSYPIHLKLVRMAPYLHWVRMKPASTQKNKIEKRVTRNANPSFMIDHACQPRCSSRLTSMTLRRPGLGTKRNVVFLSFRLFVLFASSLPRMGDGPTMSGRKSHPSSNAIQRTQRSLRVPSPLLVSLCLSSLRYRTVAVVVYCSSCSNCP